MALKIAAIQMACSKNTEDNIKKADRLVRDAADKGARIILLPELFETLYFCQEKKYEFYELASTLEENRAVGHFQDVARELEVVLPISFFEKTPTAFFNTVAMIDADGKILGKYRKSHIPDAPGYHEKFYFTPGDTGFQVWTTRYARIGALICWDQYFGEAARILAMKGADIICYPSAAGSIPGHEFISMRDRWQKTMQGHAAGNVISVMACNRVGKEAADHSDITFFGSSFITDNEGRMLAEAGQESEGVIVTDTEIEFDRMIRPAMGFFRDRRPDLYGDLATVQG